MAKQHTNTSPSMPYSMPYRLALDLGSTSLGWSILRLSKNEDKQHNKWQPCAIVKAGVRIFSDGRNPKDGSSLAVTRREARAMRRRRDRLLKRKSRMMDLLVEYGFFPQDPLDRKKLETLNPYELRAKGLDEALPPEQFARALFHINQRRGFKSNRKTDSKENDSGAMKQAIAGLRSEIGEGKPYRTVGELLRARQLAAHKKKETALLRARYRQERSVTEEGKSKLNKYYDLYIDRQMIEEEFDALWAKQAALNPTLFTPEAGKKLKDCLLFQRPLKPVQPGRCTLIPEEPRAPLALPSTQRFRIYQEVNNLRILNDQLGEIMLTVKQRDKIVTALEKTPKQTFKQITKLLDLPGTTQFNLQDAKRQELKGNATSTILKKDEHFGSAWFALTEDLQDEIVSHLIEEQSEADLIAWLQQHTGINEAQAQTIANAKLPDGYGSLSTKALAKILPKLREDVITYDKAAKAAGFHHSLLSANTEIKGVTFPHEIINPETGEIKTHHIFKNLPYYGEPLQRHVGFGTGKPQDPPEKRFGRIANPTVHIGLNQIRVVVNALIKRYGHPQEIIVEVARELKQSKKDRDEEQKRQAANQKRNNAFITEIAKILEIPEYKVKRADIEKMILWEELNPHDAMDRRCPYSGVQISKHMLFTPDVEIEHILPFSRTLDDSLNNKTVSLREANRAKNNRTPWEAKASFDAKSWDFEGMVHRVMFMSKGKRSRFGEDGYQLWLRDEKDFIARALNDTRYLSRIAREYLNLICPQATRVIPGQMTALLRQKFGLNDILGLKGEKNRNDHRHHAVDACVIAVTDQGTLQQFANASKQAKEERLEKLVKTMPDPWPDYYNHVKRAIDAIKVSHKPDHGYEGGMHNDTAYGLKLGNGQVYTHKPDESNHRILNVEKLNVIEITAPTAIALHGARHGTQPDGSPKPYKGYKGDSNYCMEITRDEKGKWQSQIISTFEAYQFVRKHGNKGKEKLLDKNFSINGKPLVMRLIRNDCIKLEIDGVMHLMRVVTMSRNGNIALAPLSEANVDARNRNTEDPFKYTNKTAGTLLKAKARRVTISPTGELTDYGFKP